MNRRKFALLFTVACLILSGCNQSDSVVTHTASDNSSQTTADEESVTTVSVTPQTSDKTAASEENISGSSSDEADPDSDTDESSNDSDENTSSDTSETSSDESTETGATVSVTTTAVVTTTTAAATTTKTSAPAATTTTTAVTTAPPVAAEPSAPTILTPTADGKLTFANQLATIDYSNTSDGYVMAKYTGSATKIKVQITDPKGTTQTYTLSANGSYEAFPLTGSDGTYTIVVAENVSGNSYAIANSGSCTVKLSSALAPYLRPNDIVYYTYNDAAVTKASQLCAGTTNALQKVDKVYTWIVDNVSYDYALASSVASDYVPDINKVINKKIGICYDYAAAMAAMLRSQNVPTQLVVGYAGSTYHAWVNVYVTNVGWVYGVIYFDGSSWHRMDPTFAATSNSSKAIMDFISNNSNYTTRYLY